MTTPSPDEVARLVADIIDTLTRGVRVGEEGQGRPWRRESLVDGYRWLVNVPGSRQRHDGNSGANHGPSDSTGRAATSAPFAATKAKRVRDHLETALAAVQGAVNELQEGFSAFDRGRPVELPSGAPRKVTADQARFFPKTITADELRRAKQARARRAARGESFGDA